MSNTTLSSRELEILRLIAAGECYREIARQLEISYNTVSQHAQNITRKLQVCTITAAIVVAIRDGDIDPDEIEVLRR
jgi:DNA-binding NarL/FixJ family response regulator